MTLAKLAGIAGVSVSTASKAFSGSPEISESTREMIFELAKKYGCFDKYSKNKYDHLVYALIVPEINSEHYYNFVIQIQKRIEKNNGMLLISTSNFSKEKTRELFRYYTEFCKVDGIIIVGVAELIDNYDNFPVVVIGSSAGKNVDTITYSSDKAIRSAVELLISNGHRKIAFIGEKLTVSKEQKFIEAMSDYGICAKDEYILCAQESRFEQAGKECAEKLLSLKEPPSAIVCAYDYIALGAMDVIRKKGLRVPEDISLIGMDNINFTSLNGISLTSISHDFEKICDTAFSILKRKMKNGFYAIETRLDSYESVSVDSELVVRESVAKAK